MALDFYDCQDATPAPDQPRRNYISVLFDCCRVYARIYRSPDQPFYEGRCPRCLRTLHVGVSPTGTRQRIFRAE